MTLQKPKCGSFYKCLFQPLGSVTFMPKPDAPAGRGRQCGGSPAVQGLFQSRLGTARSRLLGRKHQASREALDYVLIKAVDGASIDNMKSRIRTVLRQTHRLRAAAPDDFKISNPADVLVTQEESASSFGALLASIASISLIVGARIGH